MGGMHTKLSSFSLKPSSLHSEDRFCRVCRGEATKENPLFFPCKCNGSIRFVHEDCLCEWLKHSRKDYCELCRTQFIFQKIYNRNISFNRKACRFSLQILGNIRAGIFRVFRYILIAILWLVYVPWVSQQALKLCRQNLDNLFRAFAFLTMPEENFTQLTHIKATVFDHLSLTYIRFCSDEKLNNFITTILEGQLITGTMTGLLLFAFLLNEWYIHNTIERQPDAIENQENDVHRRRPERIAARRAILRPQNIQAAPIEPDHELRAQHAMDGARELPRAGAMYANYFPQHRNLREDNLEEVVPDENRGPLNAEMEEDNQQINDQINNPAIPQEIANEREMIDQDLRQLRQNVHGLGNMEDANENMDGFLEFVGFRGPLSSLISNVLVVNGLALGSIYTFIIVPESVGKTLLFSIFQYPFAIIRVPGFYSLKILKWALFKLLRAPFKILVKCIHLLKISPTKYGRQFIEENEELQYFFPGAFLVELFFKLFIFVYRFLKPTYWVKKILTVVANFEFVKNIPLVKFFMFNNKLVSSPNIFELTISESFPRIERALNLLSSIFSSVKHGYGLGTTTPERVLSMIVGYSIVYGVFSFFLSIKDSQEQRNQDLRIFTTTEFLRRSCFIFKVFILTLVEIVVFPIICGILISVCLADLLFGNDYGSLIQFVSAQTLSYFIICFLAGSFFILQVSNYVTMIKESMRPGVLFFIRDASHPNFNPIRDMLKLSVWEIFQKWLFNMSCFLVVIFVWMSASVKLMKLHNNLLPIQIQGDPYEYCFSFPLEFLVYHAFNFMLQSKFSIGSSTKFITSQILKRGCRILRLSSFILNQRYVDEEVQGNFCFSRVFLKAETSQAVDKFKDGGLFRVPFSDIVPPQENIFTATNMNGLREDSSNKAADYDDSNFTIVYIPSHFQIRAVSLALIHLFSSIFLTYGGLTYPLVTGRMLLNTSLSTTKTNDVNCFLIGFSFLILVFLAGRSIYRLFQNRSLFSLKTVETSKYFRALTKWAILTFVTGCILPQLLGLAVQHTFIIPLTMVLDYTQGIESINPLEKANSQPLIINLLHDWIGGLLILFILCFWSPSRRSLGIEAKWQEMLIDGWLKPKVLPVMIKFVLPGTVGLMLYHIAPILVASLLERLFAIVPGAVINTVWLYRMSFLAESMLIGIYLISHKIRNSFSKWRLEIMEELYVIGRRLTNYAGP